MAIKVEEEELLSWIQISLRTMMKGKHPQAQGGAQRIMGEICSSQEPSKQLYGWMQADSTAAYSSHFVPYPLQEPGNVASGSPGSSSAFQLVTAIWILSKMKSIWNAALVIMGSSFTANYDPMAREIPLIQIRFSKQIGTTPVLVFRGWISPKHMYMQPVPMICGHQLNPLDYPEPFSLWMISCGTFAAIFF